MHDSYYVLLLGVSIHGIYRYYDRHIQMVSKPVVISIYCKYIVFARSSGRFLQDCPLQVLDLILQFQVIWECLRGVLGRGMPVFRSWIWVLELGGVRPKIDSSWVTLRDSIYAWIPVYPYVCEVSGSQQASMSLTASRWACSFTVSSRALSSTSFKARRESPLDMPPAAPAAIRPCVYVSSDSTCMYLHAWYWMRNR